MALTAEELAKIDEAIRREQNIAPEMFENNNRYNQALRAYAARKNKPTTDKSSQMAITGKPVSDELKAYTKEQQANNFSLMNSGNIFANSSAISSGIIDPARNFTQAFKGNGNSALQLGISTLRIPGQQGQVSIPNAILQKISAEAAYNQGRSNVIDKYFGRAGTGQYSSSGVLADYLNNLSNQKTFQGSGDFNTNVANDARRNVLNDQRRYVKRMGITEDRNTYGAIMGGSMNALNRINQEQAAIKNINPRKALWDEQNKNRLAAEALKRMQEMKATTSNLPIVERVKR